MTGGSTDRRVVLEVCVDDARGLEAAVEGGAERIELCSALAVGGLTPTAGLMQIAGAAPVPVFAMIRPHAGGFVFAASDVLSMRRDIDEARRWGLAGVVLGASREDTRLDEATLAELCSHAEGLGRTLHRAFDLVPDFPEAVDLAADLGFERILTSGGRPTAVEGLDALRRIVSYAGARISIMPGSGIRPANLAALLRSIPVREVHSSASRRRSVPEGRARSLGFETAERAGTDRDTVRELRRIAAEG